jgi:hypothetical protein
MREHWGMRIEEVSQDGGTITVTTTGASFMFDPMRSVIHCDQRLGKERPSTSVRFKRKVMVGLKITARSSGAVILESKMGFKAKVNCDSLLMLRPGGWPDTE